ncbi:DNA cytosine methyltransferase [uncultured Algibacter sp.]|uniref:DNA cytosine methyltransferase n=1 Tax=uncultured Algibacter sp. TaxID=298659 RepID=UPI0026349E55|nr:DNA cytosine methyltransferase [uncultured Algibacter sp.]
MPETKEPVNIKKSVWDTSVKVEENGYYWNNDPLFKKGSNINTDKPIVAELFCGCGGTSLGFEMAGFETVLGCDIHTPSIQTFQANHPNCSTINGDIKKVDPEVVKELLNGRQLDVLIGGIPCQGFSLNNRKRHEQDDRNYMYKEFARFVEVLQPKVVVLENVSGMKSVGSFVSDIETHLSKIGHMNVKSKLLYAPDYGVPQKRKRLIFIGIRDNVFDFRDIIKTHGPETENEYVTIKDAIGDLPALKNKETKTKYNSEPSSDFQELMRLNTNGRFTGHTAPNHPAATIERIRNTKPGEPMYDRFKQRIRLAWNILSPTQVSGGIRPQFQLGHPKDNRGLTIRERCRIQSFPDNFIVKGGTVQARVQTGNAVPPFLAKAVALAIKKYIE